VTGPVIGLIAFVAFLDGWE